MFMRPFQPLAVCRSGCEPEKCLTPATLTGYVVKSIDVRRPFFKADVVCDNDAGC